MHMKSSKRFSISKKLYIFILIVVIVVSFGTATLSFFLNVDQTDSYLKRLSYNSAENFAEYVDTEYLEKLRIAVESEEFQELRKTAKKNKDEKAIENYLKEKGLWEEFAQTRKEMCTYLENYEDIKYLYIIVLGNSKALTDMYLIDDYDNPLYQTGNYDSREPELYGVDTSQKIEPTISTGSWGWLCSAYAPVYSKDGAIICHIGCDVDMEKVMSERIRYFLYILISTCIISLIVLLIAVIFIKNILAKPIRKLIEEAKKFKPEKDVTYDDAGVIYLYLKSNDEITDIYEVLRSTQMNIIDYLNDMAKLEKVNEQYLESLRQAKSEAKDKKKQLDQMEKDKQQYQLILKQINDEIREKEIQLNKMSKSVFHDPLTHVGSKTAYIRKVEELSEMIADGTAEFAVAMVDLNDLKKINDQYGHKSGDAYIKGCCRIVCDIFNYSPIFRIGGDEFVVIMIGEDYENRDELILQAKEAFAISFSDVKKPVFQRYSASIGLAVFGPEDNTFENVFKRADNEMYTAKMIFKEKNGSYR